MELPLLISFSGGRTSAFMAKVLSEYYSNWVCVFANTGKEYEETLQFINECDKRWNLNVVWLEAVVNPEKGKGTSFKIVDFETASRDGESFQDVIKKYGIPNKQFPHCTRELKQLPIQKYMQSLGYKKWQTAIGIRFDEMNRVNYNHPMIDNPFYPLAGDLMKVDERFIREWWAKQDFDLNLPDYKSNCDLCWKKSKRKRLTILKYEPERAKWWNEMENKYGNGYRFDQRQGLNVSDLIEQSKKPFREIKDKQELRNQQTSLFEPDMDFEMSCFCKSD